MLSKRKLLVALAGVFAVVAGSMQVSAKAKSSDAASDYDQIRAVMVLYAKSLDRRDYAGLKNVFTADAVGNYGAVGTHKGAAAISSFIESVLSQCGATQHLLGSMDIQVTGDHATASTYLQAIHIGKKPGFEGKRLTVWGEYRDKLVRTPVGWRIEYRELLTIHSEGDIGITF
jgi:ketosteroid isomerase-like protein